MPRTWFDGKLVKGWYNSAEGKWARKGYFYHAGESADKRLVFQAGPDPVAHRRVVIRFSTDRWSRFYVNFSTGVVTVGYPYGDRYDTRNQVYQLNNVYPTINKIWVSMGGAGQTGGNETGGGYWKIDWQREQEWYVPEVPVPRIGEYGTWRMGLEWLVGRNGPTLAQEPHPSNGYVGIFDVQDGQSSSGDYQIGVIFYGGY